MCARVVDTSRVSVAVSEVATVEGEKRGHANTHTRPDTFFLFFSSPPMINPKILPPPLSPQYHTSIMYANTYICGRRFFFFFFFVCVELPISSRHFY